MGPLSHTSRCKLDFVFGKLKIYYCAGGRAHENVITINEEEK